MKKDYYLMRWKRHIDELSAYSPYYSGDDDKHIEMLNIIKKYTNGRNSVYGSRDYELFKTHLRELGYDIFELNNEDRPINDCIWIKEEYDAIDS